MTRPPPLFPAGASRMSAYVNSGMIDPATMARDAAVELASEMAAAARSSKKENEDGAPEPATCRRSQLGEKGLWIGVGGERTLASAAVRCSEPCRRLQHRLTRRLGRADLRRHVQLE